MEGRPKREIKVPAKFKEEEEPAAAVRKKRGGEVEEDEAVYCICRRPYKEGDFMIHCDKCKEWFHGKCVKVTEKEAAKIKKYVCPTCVTKDSHAAPLASEEPSKIPKKHRSLETAKGDKSQPTGAKAPEIKTAKPPGPKKTVSETAGKAKDASDPKVGKATEGSEPKDAAGNGVDTAEAGGKVAEGAAGETEMVKQDDSEEKEGGGPVKPRPKKEDLMCSVCKNKGHIRTHRECPMYGQLPSPVNGNGKKGAAKEKEKTAAGEASKEEKHKETVPSDEDEPIMARKKLVASPKAASIPGPPPNTDPAVAAEDDDHTHMLHPVNTSSHFDTGAALLVPPDIRPLALESKAAVKEGKNGKTQSASAAMATRPGTLSGEKRKTEGGVEGTDSKRARPEIPPLEAVSEHRRQTSGQAQILTLTGSGPVARSEVWIQKSPSSQPIRVPPSSPRMQPLPGSPKMRPPPETPRKQPLPSSPRTQIPPGSPRKPTASDAAWGEKRVRPGSEKNEIGKTVPEYSRQGSGKGAKRGREETESNGGGVGNKGSKGGGINPAESDFKARTTSKSFLAGALATCAKEAAAGALSNSQKEAETGVSVGGNGLAEPGTVKEGEKQSLQAATAMIGAGDEVEGADSDPAVRNAEAFGAVSPTQGTDKQTPEVGEGPEAMSIDEVSQSEKKGFGGVSESDMSAGVADPVVAGLSGDRSESGALGASAIEAGLEKTQPADSGTAGTVLGVRDVSSVGNPSADSGVSGGVKEGTIIQNAIAGDNTSGEAKKVPSAAAGLAGGGESSQSLPLDEAGIVQLAEEVAGEIEAALYETFGGAGNPYRQQTRSLVFNLKTNPELRAKVLAREVTPKELCTATSDELARKELSQWRHAKEEELSALKVLTEDPLEALRRVRKKTHKGEQDMEMERDKMGGAANMEGGQNQGGGEGEESEATTAAAVAITEGGEEAADENSAATPKRQKREGDQFSPVSAAQAQASPRYPAAVMPPYVSQLSSPGRADPGSSKSTTEVKEEPGIATGGLSESADPVHGEHNNGGMAEGGLSLDEYLEACMTARGGSDEGSEEGGPEEMREWAASDDEEDKPIAGGVKEAANEGGDDEKDDLLWEGNLMLSGKSCPTIASFLGGERLQIETWPMTVEVKGRVKMADFQTFMTSPQLHKHRSVMVIGLKYLEEFSQSKNYLAIAGQNYLEGNRTGFSEPVNGIEMYIVPPSAEGLDALLPVQGNRAESGELIGVVVKRRVVDEQPPSSEPPPQKQRRVSGDQPPNSEPGPQKLRQPNPPRVAQRSPTEDLWSPPTSPNDGIAGKNGPQAWVKKEAGNEGTKAGPEETDQAATQARKRRDPRLRVFQQTAPPPTPPSLPPQQDLPGPPGFPLPRHPPSPPATNTPPAAQQSSVHHPPGVPSPDHTNSLTLPQPATGVVWPHHPSPPPSITPPLPPGPVPVRPPLAEGGGQHEQDDDLPDVDLPELRPYQQAMPPHRPPGTLPPLPPGPPPTHVHPPYAYPGHHPPRGPQPPLPPGPLPPHFLQQEGRAPYLPIPPHLAGSSLTPSGAPQWGSERHGRRHRGGRNRRQGPSGFEGGGGAAVDELGMQQWLRQEEGRSAPDGGN